MNDLHERTARPAPGAGRADPWAGQVLEARIGAFTAACFQLECAPPLGALVAVADGAEPLYAVVTEVRTAGIDPGRRPSPRGSAEHDRAWVLANHPQLPALLQTSFEAAIVGHGPEGAVRQELPAAPAPIFARVRRCGEGEVARFSEQLEFLRLLLATGPAADEVTAAVLRGTAACSVEPRAFLVRAGKHLTRELAAEPDRLLALLRRMRP